MEERDGRREVGDGSDGRARLSVSERVREGEAGRGISWARERWAGGVATGRIEKTERKRGELGQGEKRSAGGKRAGSLLPLRGERKERGGRWAAR
jgi:hypothetical protein